MTLLGRDVAANYLTANYTPLAQSLHITVSLAGWQAVIDRSLREMGVAEADLPTATVDGSLPWYSGQATRRDAWFSLLDYFALSFMRAYASLLVDHSASGDGGISAQRAASQLYRALTEQMADARERARAFGFLPTGQAVTWGAFTLDYIEAADPLLLGF